MATHPGPPTDVLRAFGIAGAVSHPLPGGQGRSCLADNLVLKPTDNVEEARWSASILSASRARAHSVSLCRSAPKVETG